MWLIECFIAGFIEKILILFKNVNQDEVSKIDQAVSQKVTELNNGRKAPVDAYAVYENGRVQVKPAVGGTQYSLDGLHNKVENEIAGGTIYLRPVYKAPLSANSKTVQNEKAKLEELAKRSVIYTYIFCVFMFKTSLNEKFFLHKTILLPATITNICCFFCLHKPIQK